jgi:para-nitrobenzyl esterase
LFKRVIGESGSVVGLGAPLSLAQAETNGEGTAARWDLAVGASLNDLHAVSADDIVKGEPDFAPTHPVLGITIDGYVLPRSPAVVFAAGEEYHVALLHGDDARECVPNQVVGRSTHRRG